MTGTGGTGVGTIGVGGGVGGGVGTIGVGVGGVGAGRFLRQAPALAQAYDGERAAVERPEVTAPEARAARAMRNEVPPR
jgi:hypothetical protein